MLDSLAPPDAPDRPAPRSRDYPWMSRECWLEHHERLRTLDPETKRGAELVFVGDSIVEGWDEAIFADAFARHHALRFGIGGDTTQNVLYRIAQGELSGLAPRVVVLLIGTNNFGLEAAPSDAVARGVLSVVRALATELPRARLVTLAILPREELPDAELRRGVLAANALVRAGIREPVVFADVGHHFLDSEGRIPSTLMEDFLHPTREGYRVLTAALEPILTPWLLGPAPK
ncbi:MAG TPA: GDSL-type esterase/lipase family protein [Polyangiaceae bacterium]|nr:GDSL-type esterase/lipase family protein [Polyangiaceae bacterium]